MGVLRKMLPYASALWLAGFVTAYGVKCFSPGATWAAVAAAIEGPYDLSGFLPDGAARLRGAFVALVWMTCGLGWGGRLAVFARLAGPGKTFAGIGAGIAAMGLAVCGLGLAGLLRWPCFAALALTAAGGWRELRRAPVRIASLARGDATTALLAAATAGFCLLYLGAALPPEFGWDALTYHLRVPSHYLAAGKMYSLPFSPGSYYPFLVEMWMAPGLAAGGDEAAKLLNYAFLPLIALSLARIGQGAGDVRAGWLAALLFVSLPAAGALAIQCYSDLAVSFFSLLAVAAALRAGGAWMVASAVLAGGALGCKYTGAATALICGGIWLFRPGGGRRDVPRLAFAVLVTAGVFAAWPVRNWLISGNPVYPLLADLFPRTGWNPYLAAEHIRMFFGTASSPDALERLGSAVRFPLDFSWTIQAIGVSFSALFFGLAPALALPGKRLRGSAGLAVAGVSFAAAWVLTRAGDGRYLLPAAALLAVPASVAGLRLAALRAAGAWVVGSCLAVGVLLQGGHWLRFVSATYFPWRAALGLESRSTYLARAMLPNFEYFPMAQRLNAALPPRARVLLFSDIVSYYIEREVVFDTQQVMPPVGVRLFSDCSDPVLLRRRMRQLGIGHVLYTARVAAFERECRCVRVPEKARSCYRAFWRDYAELDLELGGFRLYRLRPGRSPAAAAPFLDWPGVQEEGLVEAAFARQAGNEARARGILERMKAEEPDLVSVRMHLAELHLSAGRMKEGRRELEEARRLGCDSASYWNWVARIEAAAGGHRPALEAARRQVERLPSPRAWALLALCARAAGEHDEARRAAAEGARLAPSDRMVKLALAEVR